MHLIQSEYEGKEKLAVRLRNDEVPLKVRTEILPSEDAQARMAPNSWGAHDTELTEVPLTCISILT